MQKLLFISSTDIKNGNFGGSVCSKRNFNTISKFFDITLLNFSKDKTNDIDNFQTPKNKIGTLISNVFNYAGGLTYQSEIKILEKIKNEKYNVIFLDTSNYGRLAEKIKKIDSKIKIITFFHNIEHDFLKSRMNKEGKIYFIQFKASHYNEKLAVKYSDYCITLNPRDTKRLYEVYGGKSNLELPITFEDKYSKNINNLLKEKDYILFVGSLFFANYHGIKWFVENVMPHINKKLLIVGKDFETKKSELERKNVEVIGSVDDLTPYYLNASCMIMPIFEGAGMKVKTAEALMYGKTIYGTTEAFEGYEVEYNKVGGLCNTKEEFIEKVNNDKNILFNEYSRKVFLEKYSFESSVDKMKKFLEKENLI